MTLRAPRLACGLGLLTATMLLAAGCGGGAQSGGSGPGGKIPVVASTDVWGSVVAAVGGDNVSITSIINSPTEDPHDYESNSEDTLKVSEAQLVVSNGGGYDHFFTDAVAASGTQPRSVVAFDVAGKSGGHEHGHEHGEEHGQEGGQETNEHVFYDLATVEQVAQRVADQLGAIAPDKRKTFTANAEKFVAGVHKLEHKAEDIGKQHPDAGALATEPVADYLLQAAGVHNETPQEFAEAVEHDIDIPAQALAQTRSLISGKKIDLVLQNAQTETQTTNQLVDSARAAGIPVVRVTETLPQGTTDYLVWMGKTVDGLAAALNQHARP